MNSEVWLNVHPYSPIGSPLDFRQKPFVSLELLVYLITKNYISLISYPTSNMPSQKKITSEIWSNSLSITDPGIEKVGSIFYIKSVIK